MRNLSFIKTEQPPTVAWLQWAVLFVLCVFGLFFKIQYHEFWRDEWQAWLVARDMGLGEMLGFLYYEGHPALWYLYLKIWTLFSYENQEIAMKIAHFLPWAAALWVLFFRLNFKWWFSAAVAFGYFCFFEYGMVSRGYVFVLLFALLAVSFFPKIEESNTAFSRQKNKFTGLCLSLFLLCQTEAQGVLIALAIALYYYLESKKMPWAAGQNRQLGYWLLAAGLLFLMTVFPRGQAEELASARNGGLMLVDAFQGLFANAFLAGWLPDVRAQGMSGFGVFAAFCVAAALFFLFSKNKNLLLAFGVGTVLFYLFAALLFLGGMRQWGNFYILFIAFLHLLALKNIEWKPLHLGIVGIVLLAQISYNVRALLKDFRLPYSNAKVCGVFLREKVPTNVPIVAIDPFKTAAVGAYADRALYKFPEGEPFTYFHWLRKVYVPAQAELLQFVDFKRVKGIVLVSPNPLPPERYPNSQLWKAFDGQDLKGERVWVYMVQR